MISAYLGREVRKTSSQAAQRTKLDKLERKQRRSGCNQRWLRTVFIPRTTKHRGVRGYLNQRFSWDLRI
jgi:hypothetical protein